MTLEGDEVSRGEDEIILADLDPESVLHRCFS
jgi:hypothetical protein